MSKEPTIYLGLDTSSSNEFNNGGCDYGLIPLTPVYVNELLQYRNLVSFLYRADQMIYALECWDATPLYFRANETFDDLKDIYGKPVSDISCGEPTILDSDPELADEDIQWTECQSVQVGHDELWWVAYVKHSNIRIETVHIRADVLDTVQRLFPPADKNTDTPEKTRLVKSKIKKNQG